MVFAGLFGCRYATVYGTEPAPVFVIATRIRLHTHAQTLKHMHIFSQP